MPTITDITQQKKRTSIYNIFVDGAFFCGLSDLELSLSGLRIGEEVDSKRLDELKESSGFSKLYARALNYLSFRERSTKEVRTYLKDKTDDHEQLERVLAKLHEQSFLDDERFARNWVENRNLLKPRSKRQLQMELRQKGIDSNIVEEVLGEQSDENEQENIQELIRKKKNTSAGRDEQKLIRYLISKGFRYGDIKAVLDASEPA